MVVDDGDVCVSCLMVVDDGDVCVSCLMRGEVALIILRHVHVSWMRGYVFGRVVHDE